MEATGPTSGTYQKVKMGVTNDGKIVAAEAKLMYEAGAFPGSPVGAAAQCMFTPYDIDNVYVDSYSIVDNKPSTAAYRAPGAPSGSFGAETVVDEICERLSMDALEFRLINAAKEGTRRATGLVNPVIGCVETTEATKAHDHWTGEAGGSERRPRRRIGLLDQRRRSGLRHRQRGLRTAP